VCTPATVCATTITSKLNTVRSDMHTVQPCSSSKVASAHAVAMRQCHCSCTGLCRLGVTVSAALCITAPTEFAAHSLSCGMSSCVHLITHTRYAITAYTHQLCLNCSFDARLSVSQSCTLSQLLMQCLRHAMILVSQFVCGSFRSDQRAALQCTSHRGFTSVPKT
jgi:hypothetical protein